MYDQLKQNAKNNIFSKQLAVSMNKRLEEIKNSHDQAYADKVNRDDYYDEKKRVRRFEILGDDATYRTKMWDSLATDCAYYYDNPSLA